MLKRLELVGFKSFADKTRLDFDPGISAIVGPNGSGKSNIVDALRWILGEQSAKSLRGKEMADVIFTGSGTRRSHGMAEVSLHLDNHKRFLPLDLDEVVIARRVFRSGEGEYFINGQVARLRDIRELFLGTGAGHHAYSIIEQGKVDQILQASNKDRRYIFEEAAGISRFKARKTEALRRLDRIEQNLIRIRDVADELDRQLRSLRNQASRAKRFRELSERLKELRLRAGHAQYQQQSAELAQLESMAEPLERAISESSQSLEKEENSLLSMDQSIAEMEESLRAASSALATSREAISSLEADVANDQSRADEIESETRTARSRLFSEETRLEAARKNASSTLERYESARAEREDRLALVQSARAAHESLGSAISRGRDKLAELESASKQRLSVLSGLENSQAALESQLAFLWQQKQKLAEERAGILSAIDAEMRLMLNIRRQRISASGQLSADDARSSVMESSYQRALQTKSEAQEKLAEARQNSLVARSRLELLHQLRERHDGLDAGVRRVLGLKADGTGYAQVLGVLAEQIEAPAELADLVELSLGPLAQSLVVRSPSELDEHLLAEARKLPGRVHFIAIEEWSADRLVLADESLPWPTIAQLVQCDSAIRPLVDRVLGDIYLVDEFSDALSASARTVDLRFITRQGEILEPDGSVSTGPMRKTAGILARAAEIRQLEAQVFDTEQDVEAALADVDKAHEEVARLEYSLSQHEIRRSTLAEQIRHFDYVLQQFGDRHAHRNSLLVGITRELSKADDEIRATDTQYLEAERAIADAHETMGRLHDEIREERDRLVQFESQLEASIARLHEEQTQLAVTEERAASLQGEHEKSAVEVEVRHASWQDQSQTFSLLSQRLVETERRLLRRRAELADLYAQKDERERGVGTKPAELSSLRDGRRRLSEQMAERRRAVHRDQERLHQTRLRCAEIRMARESLVARLKDDYGVELASYVPPEDSEQVVVDEQIGAEIEDLREKIARLGSVNSEAINELADLESRSATFAHQIGDLTTAQKHLSTLIDRINEECRRLFIDSFETIRGHFQELFRKLFGGGKADILFEDENDVLESGIEIIARPPGKEPQSISLLSGGEKTMTAVALVMAIFRSKPSPFCILDEVDAALDEANIGRFVHLLREFTNISQFILITHSKTTMAAADVLHGITQRESGVSIRVSVHLEDVTHDGSFVDRERESTDL